MLLSVVRFQEGQSVISFLLVTETPKVADKFLLNKLGQAANKFGQK